MSASLEDALGNVRRGLCHGQGQAHNQSHERSLDCGHNHSDEKRLGHVQGHGHGEGLSNLCRGHSQGEA